MPRLYEVWVSTGHGITVGPRFRSIDDARRYVAVHHREASFAIRNPQGQWEQVVPRRGHALADHRGGFR